MYDDGIDWDKGRATMNNGLSEESVWRVDVDSSGKRRTLVVAKTIEMAVQMAREPLGLKDNESPAYVRRLIDKVLTERDPAFMVKTGSGKTLVQKV